MHAIPHLSRKDEFEHAKLKMKRLTEKLIITDMKSHQVCLCFDTHMLKNVFFGCGIVSFNEKQCEELKNIFELPKIKNMGLGDNFPRKMLHVKKSALGVGLIDPKKVMDS